MNDRMLKIVLLKADEANLPAVAAGLVGRVRRRAVKRAANRRRLAAVTLFAVVSSISFVALRHRGASMPIAGNGVAALSDRAIAKVATAMTDSEPQSFAMLSAEADVHERVIRAMLNNEASIRAKAAADRLAAQADPITQIVTSRNQTARLMIDRGDRLARDPNDKPEAVIAYQRVLDLFPDSTAAGTAKQRIAAIKS